MAESAGKKGQLFYVLPTVKREMVKMPGINLCNPKNPNTNLATLQPCFSKNTAKCIIWHYCNRMISLKTPVFKRFQITFMLEQLLWISITETITIGSGTGSGIMLEQLLWISITETNKSNGNTLIILVGVATLDFDH